MGTNDNTKFTYSRSLLYVLTLLEAHSWKKKQTSPKTADRSSNLPVVVSKVSHSQSSSGGGGGRRVEGKQMDVGTETAQSAFPPSPHLTSPASKKTSDCSFLHSFPAVNAAARFLSFHLRILPTSCKTPNWTEGRMGTAYTCPALPCLPCPILPRPAAPQPAKDTNPPRVGCASRPYIM